MQDDSFKYTKHELLTELLADFRNKMGSVISHIDLLELKDKVSPDKVHKINELIKNNEDTLIKTKPLLIKYLNDFEEFDIKELKRNAD